MWSGPRWSNSRVPAPSGTGQKPDV
jgi:hypothetical protein